MSSTIAFSAAAVFTDGRFGSGTNFSLFQNITCSGSASEASLQNCQMNPPSDCLPFCQGIGIRCYSKGMHKDIHYVVGELYMRRYMHCMRMSLSSYSFRDL